MQWAFRVATSLRTRGNIKRRQRGLFALHTPSENSVEYQGRIDKDVAYVHGLYELDPHLLEIKCRLDTYR
jgi:hypothetical protein